MIFGLIVLAVPLPRAFDFWPFLSAMLSFSSLLKSSEAHIGGIGMSSNRIFLEGPAVVDSLGGEGVRTSDGTTTPGGMGSSVALVFFITNGCIASGGGGGGAPTTKSVLSIVKLAKIPFDGGMGMSVRSPFDEPAGALATPSSASTLIIFDSSFASVDCKISLSTFSRLCLPFTSSANSDVSLMLMDFLGTTFAKNEGEGDFEGVRRTGGDGDR